MERSTSLAHLTWPPGQRCQDPSPWFNKPRSVPEPNHASSDSSLYPTYARSLSDHDMLDPRPLCQDLQNQRQGQSQPPPRRYHPARANTPGPGPRSKCPRTLHSPLSENASSRLPQEPTSFQTGAAHRCRDNYPTSDALSSHHTVWHVSPPLLHPHAVLHEYLDFQR